MSSGGKRKSSKEQDVKDQVTLEFPDNALVAQLAGAHHKHFVRLEQVLSVRLASRGNLVAINGAADGRARAAAVLKALYARLVRGDQLSASDIDAELRFAAHGEASVGISTPALRTMNGKVTRPRSPAQNAYLDLMRNHALVFGVGPAGTGKTYLAAAFGASLLHERRVERLILSRPALEAGERLGFLPGDLKEKVDPYLQPLYDALFDVMGEQYLRLMEQGVIEVAPLAFMRGRTLSRAFVILDEAQNCTPAQMRMALTRLGEESRMVVTGDPSQSDLPGAHAAGLNEALALLSHVEGVAVQRFGEKDVVRHALVTKIVSAYNAADAKNGARKTRHES